MAVNHLNVYSTVLSILICYTTEIRQTQANSIQGHSCEIVRCPAGTYCVNGNCVTSCDGVDCGQGQECVYEDIDCFTSPCIPIPVCKPIDKCALVLCQKGTFCVNGKCVTSCDGVACDPGQECILKVVQCFTTPCPPIPTCKPINRCAVVRCSAGFNCINGRCVKEPTCDGVVCGPGQECVLEEVQCFTTPCPPIPTCKLIDRCAVVRCRSGYKCINGSCVKEPTCVGFKCGEGEECYLKNVTCIKAPCLPVPACRPKLTCATINCIAGTVCVDNKCIPAPTCDNVVCDPGTQCYLESVECTTPPCPPPQPVCRPSCANILCLAPSTCVNGQCFPIESDHEEEV